MTLRDPQFIARFTRLISPGLRLGFRYEIEGGENLLAGPQMLIPNHNSGAPVETFILLCDWVARFGPARPVYGLAHSLVFRDPLGRWFLGKIGGVPATQAQAHAVLRAGASLLVFPGGNWQYARPFWKDRDRDFGGRKGWARIAVETQTPVMPVSIDGSHFINPIFARSRGLATLLVIPRLLGVRWFPVSLAQLLASGAVAAILGPYSGAAAAFGAYLAFLATPLVPVIPKKVRVRYHPAIMPGQSADALYDSVVRRL